MTDQAAVTAHWDRQASAGELAGTRDLGLVALEREVITAHARQGMRVLDVGCGTGGTMQMLQLARAVTGICIDASQQMIATARSRLPFTRFIVAPVLDDWPDDLGTFDLVYTQRCLINLPDWPAQAEAIRKLTRYLRPGGWYLAVEHSATGLHALNRHREAWGLPTITPPWHNRYLLDENVRSLAVDGCTLEVDAEDFSSTYYFCSRIVNAWQAQQAGHEPDYDAPINRQALGKPVVGRVGQARYWRWRRHG